MRKWVMGLSALLLAASLTACSEQEKEPVKEPVKQPVKQPEPKADEKPAEPEPTPAAEQGEFVTVNRLKDREPVPFAYEKMEGPVFIQLDRDASLHSHTTTLLALGVPHKFTLFFCAPMDRASVETVLLDRAKKEAGEKTQFAYTFQWADDRQLHLSVQAEGKDYMSQLSLDVTKAKTKSGDVLEQPDKFYASLQIPKQMFRVSLDGQTAEQLTEFTHPYGLTALHGTDEEFWVTKYIKYCQCDAQLPKQTLIYNVKSKQFTEYPLEATETYRGPGRFVFDERGFFFPLPQDRSSVPKSTTAHEIHLDGYVHGAGWSKDRRYLLMAVGGEQQLKDFDLVIRDLRTGRDKRLPGVLKGEAPENMVSSGLIPILVHDLGDAVLFYLKYSSEQPYFPNTVFQYSWKTGQVTKMKPDPNRQLPYAYERSDDGRYEASYEGLYENGRKVDDLNDYNNFRWLPNSHTLVMTESERSAPDETPRLSLYLYDADKREARKIRTGLPFDVRIAGFSTDGRWIYVSGPPEVGVH